MDVPRRVRGELRGKTTPKSSFTWPRSTGRRGRGPDRPFHTRAAGIHAIIWEFLMRPSSWKLVAYGLIVLFGLILVAPNLLTASQRATLPDWLPTQPIALGLDLKGGAHLVL